MFEANLFGCHSLNTRVRLSFQLYFNHSIWTLNSWWIDGSILIYTFVINTSSTITVDLTKSNLVQVHIYKKREKNMGLHIHWYIPMNSHKIMCSCCMHWKWLSWKMLMLSLSLSLPLKNHFSRWFSFGNLYSTESELNLLVFTRLCFRFFNKVYLEMWFCVLMFNPHRIKNIRHKMPFFGMSSTMCEY